MTQRVLSLVSGVTGWPLFLRVATLAIAVVAVSHLVPVRFRLGGARRDRRVLALPIWTTGLVAFVTVIGAFAYAFGTPGGRAVPMPAARQITPGRITPRPQTPATAYIGVYEPLEFRSYQHVVAFGTAAGQPPSPVLYYSAWLKPFQRPFAEAAAAHGAIPMVDIEPFGIRLAAVAAGGYDAYLRSYAASVRSYGRPVAIALAPEANGYWDSWGWTHTAPRVWVAAWRHMVDLFRRAGAANVIWLWAMNRQTGSTGPLHEYWPGARYVTWVGIDGYYFHQSDTFQRIFAPTIEAARAFTSKPIILSEVGIGQVAGQAQKIPDLFAGIRRYHLLGLVWFDVAQHAGLYKQDWRLEGHPAAMAAFRRGAASLARRGH